jgi:hypothetical protein
VIDVFAHQIIGWHAPPSMHAKLVLDTLTGGMVAQ